MGRLVLTNEKHDASLALTGRLILIGRLLNKRDVGTDGAGTGRGTRGRAAEGQEGGKGKGNAEGQEGKGS